jgi:hypothetical protein
MAGEEDDDDDEDTDGEMMAVEQDGQQYVVLEVIQLQVENKVKAVLLFESCKHVNRLSLGSTCYHSVQSSSDIKNIKIKIYKTIICPLFYMGFLTLREEHRLRVYKESVVRILGLRERK